MNRTQNSHEGTRAAGIGLPFSPPLCTARTTKDLPCKNKVQTGTILCGSHLRAAIGQD